MAGTGTDTAKTRGEGPVVIGYTDGEGKAHKRVPLGGTALNITPKGATEAKAYSLSDIPDNVKTALILAGAGNRIKTYITNHGKPDGSDALELADEVWAEFVAGNVYAKSTTTDGKATQGKKFDGTIYAEAWRAAYAAMAKRGLTKKSKDGADIPIAALSDDQVLDLKTSLESMSAKSSTDANGKKTVGRGERLRSFLSNTFYEKALAELKAKGVKLDPKAELEDMPF